MIVVAGSALIDEITAAAAHAYPEECCGLLVGRRGGAAVRITEAVASPNIAADRCRRFEVDPALRLAVMRRLRGTTEEIVGHYHSHPDGPPRPSGNDAAMAFETQLIWLVVAVVQGVAGRPGAFLYDPATGCFRRLALKPGD
ncbi:MAG: M67 family metallopeptidase [Rhodospirillales bacterium]